MERAKIFNLLRAGMAVGVVSAFALKNSPSHENPDVITTTQIIESAEGPEHTLEEIRLRLISTEVWMKSSGVDEIVEAAKLLENYSEDPNLAFSIAASGEFSYFRVSTVHNDGNVDAKIIARDKSLLDPKFSPFDAAFSFYESQIVMGNITGQEKRYETDPNYRQKQYEIAREKTSEVFSKLAVAIGKEV